MPTVLIADDNASGVEWAMTALRPLGCSLIHAAGGRSALAMIRSAMPDLTLLDLHMPGMDGFEVIREIRRDPTSAGLCVVAFTASAMSGDRELALDAGFTDFLSKPIGLTEFRGRVTKFLKRSAGGPNDQQRDIKDG